MLRPVLSFFFFNDTATTEIYTLSLHDALPIYGRRSRGLDKFPIATPHRGAGRVRIGAWSRSEEHTSELQSRSDLVCRLLLEKKKHGYRSNHRSRQPLGLDFPEYMVLQ